MNKYPFILRFPAVKDAESKFLDLTFGYWLLSLWGKRFRILFLLGVAGLYRNTNRPVSISWYTVQTRLWRSSLLSSVVYPHWFQCGSVSGSREPTQCRYGSWSDFKKSQKLNFCMKNIIKVDNRSKTNLWRYKGLFERPETRFIPRIPNTDPDPGQKEKIAWCHAF